MNYTSDPFGSCCIEPPSVPIRAERVVATVASTGFDDYLETWLESWSRNACCAGVTIVVFLINPTPRLERICAKYRASVIRGTCNFPLGAHIKSVLYSVSRWVHAKQYLLLDADMLITGSFRALYDVHESMPEFVLGCTKAYNFPDLYYEVVIAETDAKSCVSTPYMNPVEDYERYVAPFLGKHSWHLLNLGILIGAKAAMDLLDKDLRSLPKESKRWVTHEHARYANTNDELMASVAIARRNARWEIPLEYNFVMHCGSVAPREEIHSEEGRESYLYQEKPIASMHFMSYFGKILLGKWRRRVALPQYDPEIGPCPFPFFYREREGFFDYHNLYRFLVDRSEKGKIVEVGCFQGRSLVFLGELIHASGKPIRVDGVDYWMKSPRTKGAREMQKALTRFGLDSSVKMRQMASVEAAPTYEDNSLEAVFLDAGRLYEDVSENILLWKDKIKVGGVLAGHDFTYSSPGVIRAVRECLGEPFYSFPRSWVFERTAKGFQPLAIPALQESEHQEWGFRPVMHSVDKEDLAKQVFDGVLYGTDGAWEVAHMNTWNDPLLEEQQAKTLCDFLDPHIPCAEDIRGMIRNLLESFQESENSAVKTLVSEALAHERQPYVLL